MNSSWLLTVRVLVRERIHEYGVKRSGYRRYKTPKHQRYSSIFGHFSVVSEDTPSPPNTRRVFNDCFRYKGYDSELFWSVGASVLAAVSASHAASQQQHDKEVWVRSLELIEALCVFPGLPKCDS